MSNGFQLPDGTIWTAIGAAIAWVVRVERWKGKMLSRTEHKEICEDHQTELKSKLDTILKRLDRQDEESREHRERVSNSLHSIGLKVAVLQTQRGTPPSGDTGNHRRL